jgi:glutaredoxin-like protein NrdH
MRTVVYSKNNCVQCAYTKKLLTEYGIKFEERNIDENEEFYAQAKSLGYQQAPVVVAGVESWSGFQPDKLAKLVSD